MRSSRLLSLMMLLQVRQRCTAEVLADELQVSVRTIYRDIDALAAAGVPVYSERGPGGGFALVAGYRTQLTGLDDPETEALFMIGAPEHANALGIGQAATRARNKVMASLPASRRAEVDRIARLFFVDPVGWYREPRPTPHLSTIARALLDSTQLAISYRSWTNTTERLLCPLGLVLKGDNWYLVADDGTQVRRFCVADVMDCSVFGTPTPARKIDLAAWWQDANARFEADLRPQSAQLRASPIGVQRLCALGAWAVDAVRASGMIDDDGWTRLTLPIEPIDRSSLMLLGIGPEIEILSPGELQDEVARLASAVGARMRRPTLVDRSTYADRPC
jgi:predicted DNA-binding transcriptional regulator YafY